MHSHRLFKGNDENTMCTPQKHPKMSLQSLQTTTEPFDIAILQHYTGLKPDRPDSRDIVRVYGAPDIASADEQTKVDLRKYVMQVYHQNKMNSCAANVACAAFELILQKQAENAPFAYYHFNSSRMFVYYNSRTYDNTTGSDDGASLRDTLKGMHDTGVCRETEWPYDVGKVTQKPPQISYDKAKGNNVCKYENIRPDINQLRAALNSGFPVAFGLRIFRSFMSMKKGVVPTPCAAEIKGEPNPFMHGCLAVGYDDKTRLVTVLNSWGDLWADKGYFYMPYNYIGDASLCFNFWKIEQACEKYDVEVVALP